MNLKRKSAAFITLLVSLLLVISGCGTKSADTAAPAGDAAKEKIKVAFVYVGPVGDAGWSFAHDQGRKYLEEKIPEVESTIMESVPEGADSERVITQLAEKGNKIIFTTSFGYMDPTINVAKNYPDVTFMHNSGYKTADNVGTYFGRMYQARYLTGIVAGKTTKSNLIGYVAAMPIPEVIRGIDAFTLGVRSVNPDAKVKVVWTNTWYDPAMEKDAAKSLLTAGADVIAQHQDTPGPMQAAEEAGKYGIGYNMDMSKMAPKAVLTSAVWNWGPYYEKVVKSVMDKTWKSDQYWGPMSDGIVDIAPYGPMVSDETKQLVADAKAKIVSNKWDVFTGPIKDQTGAVKVPEGQVMSDQDMLSLDWFVEGVDGTIPK
ncbi:putative ABC-type transport system, periplasmic component/surface lipoprotein [Desulfosporosinus orientis DSM 765]|uniref:Putative ABC-type transport system, periplasmic component/surface lipoprotein n=1 Tax=Desulfosporosinus orientis (strain ATCC 19365 / DSM 765 / NCIMB 8382 / VKM B-1628 / Singapore I) TaxID=768706 RepID=G7WBZ6_DESOD|nr:BMP family ABC transporter substrate-binding protein [Desulfosporosinus orientis]AET69970.1 putative ABC-type transport system, periplasmic component/surface lipoprotein [Desulfosporosinus orientis DSM 765]